MTARSFEDVDIWQQAHQFVLDVYKVTELFPKHELYGLTSQLRRAAVSIPANFAEGFRKSGKREKVRFYNISLDSLEECRYYLRLGTDLGYADTAQCVISSNQSAECSHDTQPQSGRTFDF